MEVITPGFHTLVVDLGRPRWRSLGVPLGGAADRQSLILGNALVGNPRDAAALEITLKGPRLRAENRIAAVLCGAPFEMSSERQSLQPGKTFTLQAGEVLDLGTASAGLRAYLCIQGGLQVPLVLGSRSSLQPLRAGDRLPCLPGSIPARFTQLPATWEPDAVDLEPSGTVRRRFRLRFLDGPQADWFHQEDFLSQVFVVTPASNRMGLRLQGRPLERPRWEMVSEPVCPGTVQVTSDGQYIVLGVDGQTIGGYPQIAQVIQADLDRLGQVRPGELLVFAPVQLEEAETLFRERQRGIHQLALRLRASLEG